MNRHATYVYCSNDVNLHKIQVMQNVQERNDCVTWGAPVLVTPFKVLPRETPKSR
jgi:hypothetical protein